MQPERQPSEPVIGRLGRSAAQEAAKAMVADFDSHGSHRGQNQDADGWCRFLAEAPENLFRERAAQQSWPRLLRGCSSPTVVAAEPADRFGGLEVLRASGAFARVDEL